MRDEQPSPPHSSSGLALWQWRHEARQQAIAADIAPAEVDWLLQELAGLDRLTLRLGSFKDQPHVSLRVSLSTLAKLWQQRIQSRVPVQYLAGTAPWRTFSLAVSPAVLIPRPETECLIDLVIAAVEQSTDAATLQVGHWSDLGTGSGAIALGLATAFPEVTVHAVDVSEAALAIARHNAETLGLSQQVQFYCGSWFEPLNALKGKLSGMVSNPPYIPTDEIAELQPEVAQHEPHLALDGGADGLACIRHLVHTAPTYLRSGGIWLIEMMAGQAELVQALLEQQGSYDRIQIHRDLEGVERFALAYRQ